MQGFRAAGGVAGAIAQSAETLFEDRLDEHRQQVARRLLLRLVTPGEGTADSRRRMPLEDLERDVDPVVMAEVADSFVAARLLSVDDSSVELAHEALIAGWPRLHGWIDAERENLRTRQRIERAAHEWEASGRDPDLLYRGAPLAAAASWADDQRDSLDTLQREFIDRSETARRDDEHRRATAAARAQRNRRRATAALAVLALASVIASVVAFTAARRATGNARVAELQFARALGTSALGQADSDPAQALLLAVESIARSESPTVDARAALVQARLAMAGPGPVPFGPSISTPGSFKVALRPDGLLAAVADQTGPIRLYDTQTGQQVGADLERHTAGARALDFSPDGRNLFSGGSDGTVLRWDVSDPASVRPPTVLRDTAVIVWSLDVHPDGTSVIVAADDGTLRWLDIVTGDELRVIDWKSGAGIVSVAFSPDGRRIVASNRDGRLQSWMTSGGPAQWGADATPAGPNLWEIVFSPDGEHFATAGDRDAAHVHDTESGQVVPGAVFGGGAGLDSTITQIHGVAFSSDGTRLIGGSSSGAVHTWAIDEPSDRTSTVARHTDAVEDGALSADGSTYVTVGDDKRLRVWRLRSVPVSIDRPGFDGGAFGVAFDPSGGRIAVGDGAGHLHIVAVDGTAGGAIDLVAHDGVVRDVAWSADGMSIASIGDDGDVQLWDAKAIKLVRTVGAHRAPGRSVAFSPDGRWLLSTDRGDATGRGAQVLVWDLADRSLRAELPGHSQGVNTAQFSADGEFVATADGRGAIRVWDTSNFALLREWAATEQVNLVWALSFSRSGLLASADSSEDMRVWDPRTGLQVGRTISGLGTDGATGVDFNGAGDTIAVLTCGGELRLVDWSQGANLASSPIPAHPGSDAFNLAFDVIGSSFATTGTDGVLRIWDVLSVEAACNAAGRELDMDSSHAILGTTQPVGCGTPPSLS